VQMVDPDVLAVMLDDIQGTEERSRITNRLPDGFQYVSFSEVDARD
jgi:hypothetical protein